MRSYRSQREFFTCEWYPQAKKMGVGWTEFWSMNPRILKAVSAGYEEQLLDIDYMNWMSGQYLISAINTCFVKEEKYLKKPILKTLIEESRMTDEERELREMEEEIRKMDAWIAADRARGLPETSIN